MSELSSEVKAETFNIGPTSEFIEAFEQVTGSSCSPANLLDCICHAPDEFARVVGRHAAIVTERGAASPPKDAAAPERVKMLRDAGDIILSQIEDHITEIDEAVERIEALAWEFGELDGLPEEVAGLASDLGYADGSRDLSLCVKRLRAALDDMADDHE